jgi:hypothetical protein
VSLTTECVLRGARYSDGLWAGRLWFDSRQWQEILHSTASRPVLGPSPILWLLGTLPGGKSAGGLEANDSPLSSVEVKNGGAIPALPHTSS